MRLRVASRKSDLARWQSVQTARALSSLHEKPEIEYLFKASLGDQDLDTPLARMGAKGVFTEDFYLDLQAGNCDLVVHSWKDLPVDERADTHIAMTLPRADVRDLLLIPEGAWLMAVQTGRLQILTSSPRRVYNLTQSLARLLPVQLELEFLNVRGNLPTRLGKMHSQQSALILAKAGVDRLLQAEGENFLAEGISVRKLIADCRFMVLPLSLNPAAPAQGALAVEVVRKNQAVNALCERRNDRATYAAVAREREILKMHGGGCHQKIGATVLRRAYGDVVSIRGITDSGEILKTWKIESSSPWTRARSRDQVFPLEMRLSSWFEREPVAADLAHCHGLIVSRAEALPDGFKASSRQYLWTAGVQTWRRLAERGLWVNGTFDGLGEENEAIGLEEIAGKIAWSKVSHSRAPASVGVELIVTYDLKIKAEAPQLKGKTHFFWASATSFERARELYPDEIQNGYHATGPGHTFDCLRRVAGLKHPVKVFIGLDQFLAETLP